MAGSVAGAWRSTRPVVVVESGGSSSLPERCISVTIPGYVVAVTVLGVCTLGPPIRPEAPAWIPEIEQCDLWGRLTQNSEKGGPRLGPTSHGRRFRVPAMKGLSVPLFRFAELCVAQFRPSRWFRDAQRPANDPIALDTWLRLKGAIARGAT